MRILISFLISNLILLWICKVDAQTDQFTGLIMDDTAYAQTPLLNSPSSRGIVMPKIYSLRKYCPFPQSQGKVSSCVGWAVGYGAMTILYAKQKNITDRHYISENLSFSASYIYNQVKKGEDCKSGASLIDALDLLKRNGNCFAKVFPNSPIKCTPIPSYNAHTEAAKYKLKSNYYKLFDSIATNRTKIKQIKRQIATGNPVIIGFEVAPPRSLKGKTVWNVDKTHPNHHAMVVIGYDENGFEIMNSFGYSWGVEGFIWIPYEDFGPYVRQAFVLENNVRRGLKEGGTSDTLAPMSGALHLLRIRNGKMDSVGFQYENSLNLYESTDTINSNNNEFFKLKMEIPAGKQVYLFNINTAGSTNFISVIGSYEKDTMITLPEEGEYQFSNPGTERIVAIFSYEAIDDVEKRLSRLEISPSEDLNLKLRTLFEQEFIKPEDVDFLGDIPFFKSNSRFGDGTAVPIILDLSIK